MGLFDKVLGGKSSEDVAFSKQEAFASIMLAIVAADGDISDEEGEAFLATINRMKLFKSQTTAEYNAMVDKLFGLFSKKGAAFIMQKGIESLPSELRETAFAIAADFIFADGSVEDEEKELLEQLQVGLGVSNDVAMKIVEVMEIKSRG